MKPTGRVLIAEFVLRPVTQPDLGRLVDLEMLIMTGSGRERTATEFSELLEQSGLFALNPKPETDLTADYISYTDTIGDDY
jgi:hypothetical protein